MQNIRGVAGTIAVGALLIGCSSQPPAPPMAVTPPAPATAPATASARGGIDGVYRAPAGGISGKSRCGTTKFGYPIGVCGGVASMASGANGRLEGPVGPDNSIAIEKGRAGLRGQFSNGQFNGTYSSGNCSYALTYAKR